MGKASLNPAARLRASTGVPTVALFWTSTVRSRILQRAPNEPPPLAGIGQLPDLVPARTRDNYAARNRPSGPAAPADRWSMQAGNPVARLRGSTYSIPCSPNARVPAGPVGPPAETPRRYCLPARGSAPAASTQHAGAGSG